MNADLPSESRWTSTNIYGVRFTTALVRAVGILVFVGGVALGVQVFRVASTGPPYRFEAWLMVISITAMIAGIVLEQTYHHLRRREVDR